MKKLKYKNLYLGAEANEEFPNLWVDEKGITFVSIEEFARMGYRPSVSTQEGATIAPHKEYDPEAKQEQIK